jgi:hypothetical protein
LCHILHSCGLYFCHLKWFGQIYPEKETAHFKVWFLEEFRLLLLITFEEPACAFSQYDRVILNKSRLSDWDYYYLSTLVSSSYSKNRSGL